MGSKKPFGYIVTNTRFTQDAIDYAQCEGLKLVSWDYPKDQGLKVLLENTQIHPITLLSSLTKKEKEAFLKNDLVHCRQLLDNEKLLHALSFNHAKISNILSEAEDLCSN